MRLRQFGKAQQLRLLRIVNFSLLLPQFERVAAIRARIAQHLGYTNCIDIVIGLEILSGSNVVSNQKVHSIIGHRQATILQYFCCSLHQKITITIVIVIYFIKVLLFR